MGESPAPRQNAAEALAKGTRLPFETDGFGDLVDGKFGLGHARHLAEGEFRFNHGLLDILGQLNLDGFLLGTKGCRLVSRIKVNLRLAGIGLAWSDCSHWLKISE